MLKHSRERSCPRFFLDSAHKNKLVDLVRNCYPNSFKQTIADADEVCKHIFDLLGSSAVFLGENIDWHTDFKVGWTWKRKYHKLIDCSNRNQPCDVKIPWELSRCQHFATLGKAYWYTGDEKYAIEFVTQITDWIESNPPGLGVNWVYAMDTAIRVVNWIWGYYFFSGSSSLTDEFLVNFLKSLLVHGRHIMGNLENKGSVTTNHYLSNLVGLIYLGVLFPEFKEAERWRSFGIRELIREMERQVLPDGADYEGSISYHRLVIEMFLSVTLLVLLNEQNNAPKPAVEHPEASRTFPEWYMKRLEKAVDFVIYYTKPDGTVPQIGDNDDGRLHILSDYGNWNKLDHRYLLSVGAVLFDRPDFKAGAGQFHEEALWLFGEAGFDRFNSLATRSSKPRSRAFPQAGLYVMRHADLYMIVDCMSNAPQMPSGHRHNSRLSFELFAYGRNFIVDPGTYVYTADPKWRNTFRSTAYHNTVQVDGQEQNEFAFLNLFSLGRQAEVRINRWQTSDKYDFLDVEHSGYERLVNPLTHRRQIFFNKQEGYWLIRDILTNDAQLQSRGKHSFEVNLHFAPMEVSTNQAGPLSAVATDENSASLLVIPIKPNGLELSAERGWISYSYGVKTVASVIKYRKLANLPIEFLMILYPYTKSLPNIDLHKIQRMVSTFMEGKN